MKKIILPLLLAVMMFGTLQAQDTLWQKVAPLGNYFYNNWIDTTQNYACSNVRPTFSQIVAKQYVAENKDTLLVYGIAAMMANLQYLWFTPNSLYPNFQAYLAANYPEDPSFDNCEERLLLYQYHDGVPFTMQQLGDSLPVHILHTPVSYYLMSYAQYADTTLKPVYERYFSAPQAVHDTFFVGFTQTDGGFSKDDSIWHDVRPNFGCLSYRHVGAPLGYDETVLAYIQDTIDTPPYWQFRRNYRTSYFLFPILTPAPPDTVVNPNDTTVNPNDTIVNPNDTTGVGIGERELLQRYVAVSPNPATSSATVTSSFGLSQVDLYDPQGRLLKTFPAATKASSSSTSPATLSLTLDLSALPRGAYLLRILTPLGPTTKKLLLQ